MLPQDEFDTNDPQILGSHVSWVLCIPVADNYTLQGLILLQTLSKVDHVKKDKIGEAEENLGIDEK